MLTFLRKIRRSLIESGSTQKYLLYAIGEIALVVIGILIALQINNWNEDSKNEKMSAVYIQNLISDVVKDTMRINSYLKNSAEMEIERNNYYNYLKKGNITPQQLQDSLARMKIFKKLFDPSKSTYQDLLSTGNLSQLDPDKRKAIIGYYSFMEPIERFLDEYDDKITEQQNKAYEYLKVNNKVDFYGALNFQRDRAYIVH